MPTYTAFPTTAEVATKLAALGITLRSTTTGAYQQQIIDAVIVEVGRETRREFLASAPATARTFDGSGTPEIEVDEFVSGSITTVKILGAVGTTQSLNINTFEQFTDTLLPCTRIKMYRSTVPWYAQVYIDHFPAGRENIEVTATWGYGATIPADLWDAVASEAAHRLAGEAVLNLGYNSATGMYLGAVKSWSGAGVSESYGLPLELVNGMWWTQAYARALKNYRRPLGRHLRRVRAPLV